MKSKLYRFYNALRQPAMAGVVVFAGLFLLSEYLAYQKFLLYNDAQKREMIVAANLAKERLHAALNNSVVATQTLAFVIKKYGVPENFEEIGREILSSNKFVDAIQIVENDEITHVYPLKGNEVVLGYKVLQDSARNKEAIKAIERKSIFFAGPFELKQGGLGIVGRLPIFIEGKFWGFSAAVVHFSTLIEAAKIGDDANADYLFQLTKKNPDTGEEEFFLPNVDNFKNKTYVAADIPDGEWRLYVMPKNESTLASPIPFSILGLLLSLTGGFFAWFITKKPFELTELVQQKTQALSASEERYRSTLDRVSDAFIALDKNWNYTFVNAKAAELHGRKPEDLLGKNIWEEFPIVKNEPFYEALLNAMKKQQPQMLELYYSTFQKWFEDYIYPSPDGVTVYYRDVTEKKKIEEQINNERKLSDSILRSLPGIFYMYDRTGKFLRWNKNFETVSGYSTEEVSRMHPLDFFDEDEKQLLTEKINNVFVSGSDEVEANFLTKSGKKIPYYFNGFAVNINGEDCLIGTGIDISTRIQAEQRTKLFIERFEYVSRATNDIVWDWDLKEQKIWWNDNFYTQLGISKTTEKLTIHSWENNIHPEDKNRVLSGIYDAIQQKRSYWVDEYRMMKNNGSEMYVFDRGYMIFEEGKPLRMIGAMVDITIIKQAEAEVIESQKALRKLTSHLQTVREEERAAIAREIHDELGQQLTVLKMDVNWLSKRIKQADEEINLHIQQMLNAIDATIKTVRKIASELRPGILDDLGLVAALEWQSAEFEKRTGIKVSFSTNAPYVKCERKLCTAMFRLFQESLTNVARHAQATSVEAKLLVKDNEIEMRIADNGKGFSPGEAKEQNTLGLLGMKERVLELNGTFTIDSQIGKGTTIFVKIPLILSPHQIIQ